MAIDWTDPAYWIPAGVLILTTLFLLIPAAYVALVDWIDRDTDPAALPRTAPVRRAIRPRPPHGSSPYEPRR